MEQPTGIVVLSLQIAERPLWGLEIATKDSQK
jgi:hypothetical protein